MPLSQPVAGREHVHIRRIELQGYFREDGLFDVEARMTDTKSEGFSTGDRWIEPGEPLHGMSMRITVDEQMTIVGCEAAMDYTPYGICPQIAPDFGKLVGLRMGRGFMRKSLERVGGIHGCTHLRELLQPMATVVFQTLYPVLSRRNQDSAQGKPALINTCHTYRSDSSIVQRRWPEYFTGAVPEPVGSLS